MSVSSYAKRSVDRLKVRYALVQKGGTNEIAGNRTRELCVPKRMSVNRDEELI